MDDKDKYNYKDVEGKNFDSRYEEALAMGVAIPKDGYWGNVPSRICGAVGGAKGGEMVREAVEGFEMKLAEKEK